MGGLIPKSVIEEVEHATNIVDLVGSYLRLQSGGRIFRGLCPFHSEKTPSFTVYPQDNHFHCFGCGASGTVFTFIMKIENLDFASAVEFLAARAGITVSREKYTGKKEDYIERTRAYEINAAAAKYFWSCLCDRKIGGDAMAYLTRKRALGIGVIKHFGLGFAPDSYEKFCDHMRSLGYTDKEVRICDLYGQKGDHYYARFRNRIMFPIIDAAEHVIGFGGRVTDDSTPKYLNSADTPVFKKSRNLFALNFAKKYCSEYMILCEGYMDVIALHAAGFENAVATLGTAITADQARLISRYSKKVIIVYDNDEAGRKADERAIRLLSEAGLEVRVLKVDGAKDPDEFIRKFGKDAFAGRLKSSMGDFEYRLGKILAKYDIGDTPGRVTATKEICDLISGYGSAVEKEVYISEVSKILGISADGIRSDVKKKSAQNNREYMKRQSGQAIMSAKKIGNAVNREASADVAASSAEEVILGLLMLFPEYRKAVVTGETDLKEEYFCTEFARKTFKHICDLERDDEGYGFSVLCQFFTADEQGTLLRLQRQREELSNNSVEVLNEAVRVLKIKKECALAEEAGDKFALIKFKRKEIQKKKEEEKDKPET